MPYDTRPVSKGGNRGIDEQFSRMAPKGKFRLIGVDTFDGGDWVVGDYKSLSIASEMANNETAGKQMLKMYVYDDLGECRHSAGSF